MARCLLILFALLAVFGCQKVTVSVEEAILPEDVLTDDARAELHLPSRTGLTLANPADIEYVKNLDPAVTKTVEESLKPTTVQISAARPIGNYLLLWVAFPNVVDGGVDLIFSVEKKRIVGTFCGGYRG